MLRSKTKSVHDRRKSEYAASGLTRDRIGSMSATIKQLTLSTPQKDWIENAVIEEIYSLIDLSVATRTKSLRLLFTFRALPILTSLLTALAAQVQSIQQISLFAVNFFTVCGAIANESNRLNKHYANWVFARSTANDLYSTTIKFLAVPNQEQAFPKYVREIARLQQRYDHTINDLLSADLDTAPQDKDKIPNRPTAPGETMAARNIHTPITATENSKAVDTDEDESDGLIKESPASPQQDKNKEDQFGGNF